MNTPRDSFVIYRTIWDAVDCMPDATSKLHLLEMIFSFGFDGVMPEKEKTPEYATFLASYKAIESACNRHDAAKANGEKGGRPRKYEDNDNSFG